MLRAEASIAQSARTGSPMDHLDQVVAIIVQTVDPQAIVLFGSCARGEAKADSDLDLLVVKDLQSTAGHFELLFQVKVALMAVQVSTDIVIKTPAEIEHWRDGWIGVVYDAVREGKLVYGDLRMGAGNCLVAPRYVSTGERGNFS